MPRHNLNPENNVHGAFTLEKQRLKFQTGNGAMVQRLRVAQATDTPVSVCLLAAAPIRDFTGHVESVDIIAGEKPTCWAVTMREGKASR